ncbi:MAG: regulatory iron-sulfur-containing complex subunit RicT, partial [Humidesulfovibrio sp.]|nr:regulatory iron-sulfur-containing complex subunit RicT [Humidesulfovibrio sp.]
LGIKFSDHGPVCYFASGAHVVRAGQSVLVETDQGLALGQVATAAAPEAAYQDAHAVIVAPAESAPAESATASSAPAPFEAVLVGADWQDAFSPLEVPSAEIQAVETHSVETQDVEPAKGQDAASSPEQAQDAGTPHGGIYSLEQAAQYQPRPRSAAGLQLIYRLAGPQDLETGAENKRLARRAFNFCRGCIAHQQLDMKLVDVEVLHDRSKMIFYFTAPNRIDFRELIKSLVREFHTRIELRQIGVRHETQMIGAIGNCGQVVCCRRFLRKFAPVTIKMAKEQNLFLNPAKISGICGRLLCCLSYEQKGYEEFHKQCPKIGKRIPTAIGTAKILRANFFKKSISVWVEDVGEREFTLEEWKDLVSRQISAEGAIQAPEGLAPERQGRQGGGRPSAGRPTRPERPARPERPERSERPEPKAQAVDSPEPAPKAAATQGADASSEPGAEHTARPEGEAPRSRPRRKRRKGRGPKPA